MYRSRSDDTWSRAYEAYEAGETAETVCERFGLGLSNFRKRARQQGRRLCDLDDPDPADPCDMGEDLPEMDEAAFAAFAFRRMTIEARRGRLQAALGWARLRDMALRQLGAAQREPDRLDAARARRRRQESAERLDDAARVAKTVQAQAQAVLAVARTDGAPRAAKVDEVDEVHPVFPLTRAQRRRKAALERKRGPP